MSEQNRRDIANIINEHVSAIRSTESPLARSVEVQKLTELFEGMVFDPALLRLQLRSIKNAAKNGDHDSVSALRGIAEALSEAAALDDCMSIAQYKGKLTTAFESAKQVLIENGAAEKSALVDTFRYKNIGPLLAMGERISALQGEQYSDPKALYDAIKNVKVGRSEQFRSKHPPKP